MIPNEFGRHFFSVVASHPVRDDVMIPRISGARPGPRLSDTTRSQPDATAGSLSFPPAARKACRWRLERVGFVAHHSSSQDMLKNSVSRMSRRRLLGSMTITAMMAAAGCGEQGTADHHHSPQRGRGSLPAQGHAGEGRASQGHPGEEEEALIAAPSVPHSSSESATGGGSAALWFERSRSFLVHFRSSGADNDEIAWHSRFATRRSR